MTTSVQRVLVMAGGTGGHIFPALAAARAFQAQGIEVKWLGTEKGLESKIVPDHGLDIFYLDVAGVRGQGLKRLLSAPFKIAMSVIRVIGIIRHYKPDLVLGMGGFVTGPGGIGAWLGRTPLFIHEQNAIAGFTNKVLAKFATKVFQAFPSAFMESGKVQTTGNPVRQEIVELKSPEERFATRINGPLHLLVLGGSQGAVALNETVPGALAQPALQGVFEIRHQAGPKNLENTKAVYAKCGVEANVSAFIDDMAEAYAWADMVICRSGALTVSEIASAGVAALFVPYPHAVDDHQTKNAEYLVAQGAAKVVQQASLTESALAELLKNEFSDRATLLTMANAARSAAKNDATLEVVNGCLEATCA
ncbi:undecaprenyldiphospho-muramoylpentapeptide beta-N-acetylglucosaminyltransferase [Gammaproteobacteria bacterium 42_54_T18]|nr:undecaprenyldiphospho-muramoylpentapeptide beta-N-acetylglucosaminyltransferase [Gammaproteobacteria bacterium 42_54_T18]